MLENWEKSKQRYEALWERERADRSSVYISVLKDGNNPVVYPPHDSARFFELSLTDEQFIFAALEEKMKKYYFAGDAFPVAGLYLGTSGHCGYTKNYRYSFGNNTVWFEPVIKDIEKENIEYDDSSKLLDTTRRIISYLGEKHRNDFFLANTDNCSSLDALANLRDNSELLMDMILFPEEVTRGICALQKIFHKTENEFMPKLTALNDGGTVTDWMGLWSPGRHHQLQCDLSVMISTEMFERFVMPELEENAAFFDRTVYHLDGQEQIRHLDMILSIKGIDLIQWTPVAGQPDTVNFVEVLKKIQKAGKGLVLMPHSYEMPRLLDELDPAGVHYYIYDIATPSEADEMVALISRKCSKK